MSDRRVAFGRTFPTGDPSAASRWRTIHDTQTITVNDGYELETVDIIVTEEGEIDCSCAASDCPHLIEMTADDESSVDLLAAFIGNNLPAPQIKVATRIAGERETIMVRFVQWGAEDKNPGERFKFIPGETMFDVYWSNVPEGSPLYEPFRQPIGSVEVGTDSMKSIDEMMRVNSEGYVGNVKCPNKSHFRTKRSDVAYDSEDVASIALYSKCKDCQRASRELGQLIPDADDSKSFPKG